MPGIERHNGDHVREALNRHRFKYKEAHGEVEGEDVLLVATLRKGKYPTLRVFAGGGLETYDDDGVEDEYSGGKRISHSFERIHQLNSEFRRLANEYDLEVL